MAALVEIVLAISSMNCQCENVRNVFKLEFFQSSKDVNVSVFRDNVKGSVRPFAKTPDVRARTHACARASGSFYQGVLVFSEFSL